jgi:hypothetical protein
MDKQKLADEIMKKIPDGSKIIFAGITVLTEDFQTLNCTVEGLDSEEMEVV